MVKFTDYERAVTEYVLKVLPQYLKLLDVAIYGFQPTMVRVSCGPRLDISALGP